MQRGKTDCVCAGRGALTSYQIYLPPANEVCEGYVFTGVCLSVHRGRSAWQGGACVAGCVCVWQGGMHGRGMCVAGGHAWQGAFLSHIYFMFYLTSRLYNLFTRFGSQMKRCLVLNFFFLKLQTSIVSEKTLLRRLNCWPSTVNHHRFKRSLSSETILDGMEY